MSEIMRERYCISIENSLTSLRERLDIRIAGNLTDLHIYAEAIMIAVLNPTFDLDLKNANISSPNAPAIDLVDDTQRVIIQISSDASRNKIQSTLMKGKLKDYPAFHLLFMFLVEKHPEYKKLSFENPHNVSFDIDKDVFDIATLMTRIRSLPMARLEAAHDGLRREIHLDRANTPVLARGLSDIVGALMVANPDERRHERPVAFRIDEKLRVNSLVRSRQDIQELSALTYPLAGIYAEYEREGTGRARSVFHHLQMAYRQNVSEDMSPDDIYDATIHTIVEELCCDPRLVRYTFEDVEFYVAVIVVDAFMRCKLFVGPNVWEDK